MFVFQWNHKIYFFYLHDLKSMLVLRNSCTDMYLFSMLGLSSFPCKYHQDEII